MKQRSYVFVFLSILLCCGVAQKSIATPYKYISPDSLWKQVKKYYKSSPTLALDYANELQKIAKKDNNTQQEANAFWSMGVLNKKLGNYNKSIEAYFKVLPIYKELGDTKQVATTYFNIAKIFTETKNHVSALAFYKNALSLYTQINYKKGIAKVQSQIGKSYVNLRNPEKAENHLNIALKLASNKSLPLIYNLLGVLEYSKGNYEKSKGYYKTSLMHSEQENNMSEKAATLLNIGVVNSKLNNLKTAKEYAQKALTLSTQNNDIDKQIKPQILLAEIAYKQKGGNRKEVNTLVTTVRGFDANHYNAYLQEALYYIAEKPQQDIIGVADLKEMMSVLAIQSKVSSDLYEKTKILLNQHSLQLSIDKVKNEQKMEVLEEKNDVMRWGGIVGLVLFLFILVWFVTAVKHKKRLREKVHMAQLKKSENRIKNVIKEIRTLKSINKSINEELDDNVNKNVFLAEKRQALEAEVEAFGDEFLELTNLLADSKNTMHEMSVYVWNMIRDVSRQGFKIPPPPPWDLGSERDN